MQMNIFADYSNFDFPYEIIHFLAITKYFSFYLFQLTLLLYNFFIKNHF